MVSNKLVFEARLRIYHECFIRSRIRKNNWRMHFGTISQNHLYVSHVHKIQFLRSTFKNPLDWGNSRTTLTPQTVLEFSINNWDTYKNTRYHNWLEPQGKKKMGTGETREETLFSYPSFFFPYELKLFDMILQVNNIIIRLIRKSISEQGLSKNQQSRCQKENECTC